MIFLKKISIKFLFLLLILIFSIFYRIKNKNLALIKIEKKYRIGTKNFKELLPRISLENNKVPSLDEIFNSRILYISNTKLTKNYIRYVRPINNNFEEKNSKKEKIISSKIFKKKKGQYDYKDYVKLCYEEKLIYENKFEYENKPIISIVIPTYNKEKIIMKSIRSIQNQSFKNIEIIIIDDYSNDNTSKYYNNLLETDPRIRIFKHLKNMGVWRTRIDGILYSRGKYIISFDNGDFYEDNYVLEDAYNIMEKYNLDSSRYLFRYVNENFLKTNKSKIYLHVGNYSKIVYGSKNIEKYNKLIFKGWGNIWSRMAKASIFIKGLYLLNDIILNLYKNLYEDVWWNTIINRVSFSYLIYERIGYIYISTKKGEGSLKFTTTNEKDKIVKEFLEFLYFEYNLLPKKNNKSSIINKLREYNKNTGPIQLKNLKSKFYILNDLLEILINDPFVSKDDKILLNKILIKSKKREKI